MIVTPVLGARYWCCLCVASVFGANAGDVFSRDLGLGYWHGLPVLAALFAVIVAAQRRARPVEAWYWIAIIIVRTAATNLSDLMTLDLGLPFSIVIGVLAVVLALLALLDRRRLTGSQAPTANGVFWFTMLVAGTLGTALGDDLAFVQELRPPSASAVMTLVLVATLAAMLVRRRTASPAAFWLTVVVVRTWGTNVGDLAADTAGLVASTFVSGALLTGLLVLWKAPAREIGWAAIGNQRDV
nr:hypothetical protein [uncultured Lichenicoccus sp.]